jgi:UDP-glucose 4-epimerase
MRILVTGSSGTIGTRLCETLLAAGHDVIGVDRVPNKWQPSVQAVTIVADMLDPAQMATVPGNVDVVVHLAANARVYELVQHPDRAFENMVTTYQALEYARKNNVKRFVFASSRETYGNIGVERYTEDLVRVENCESPYTASKFAGEAMVESYRRCYGIDQVILRFSNVYGMYDDSERLIPEFFRRAKAGRELPIFGAEKCLDFTYVDDTVQGIIRVLENFDAAKNDTYNIAYGQGTTILHVAERMKELLKSNSAITIGQSRTGEIFRYVADISKAKRILGYDPKTPLERGVEKAVEWYSAHLA